MVKNLPANARDLSSIPGSGRSPGEGNGNLLQYSCLGNPWTEEPGGLQTRGSQELDTPERLDNNNNNKHSKVSSGNGHLSCPDRQQILIPSFIGRLLL